MFSQSRACFFLFLFCFVCWLLEYTCTRIITLYGKWINYFHLFLNNSLFSHTANNLFIYFFILTQFSDSSLITRVERQMNNNNALQLNSLSCVWIFFWLLVSQSISLHLTLSAPQKRKEFISTMPILSHHCERLLIENCPKKLYIIFVYHHYRHRWNLFASHTRPALLNSQKKSFFFCCSTINNMRIWKERNVVSWGARRKKGKARKLCTACTYV